MQKFKISVIILTVFFILSGCSAKKDASRTQAEDEVITHAGVFSPKSSQQVTSYLKQELKLTNMISLDIEDISVHYGFNSNYIDDFSAYASKTESCADEIAVFKIKNSDERQTVIDALMEKVKQKSLSYKDLNTKEFDKFSPNSVSLHGDYIVVLICASPDLGYQLLDEFYESK